MFLDVDCRLLLALGGILPNCHGQILADRTILGRKSSLRFEDSCKVGHHSHAYIFALRNFRIRRRDTIEAFHSPQDSIIFHVLRTHPSSFHSPSSA